MSLLNENGRMNKHAILTFFILALFPFILGFIQNFNYMVTTNDMTPLFSYAIVNFWGIAFGLFLIYAGKAIKKWKQEKEEI
jgi:uncharacterized membrane protein YdjX (TVP38/TMEM64 family)